MNGSSDKHLYFLTGQSVILHVSEEFKETFNGLTDLTKKLASISRTVGPITSREI